MNREDGETRMELIELLCPHCGLKMGLEVEKRTSSMIVFVCAQCQTPLMLLSGEVFELDREEFAHLRKKLSPIISKLLEEYPVPSERDEAMRELAESLEKCKDVSEFIDQI